MNLTVSYLNDTVRSVTGFSVTYYIQQELTREAQRLLYYSNLTGKEIADVLGFDDDKYFNCLFSKVVGIAPGEFRKKKETSVNFRCLSYAIKQIGAFHQTEYLFHQSYRVTNLTNVVLIELLQE